ncbi:hypothetical protein [Streptomyces sp. NPDC056883]|uniref:hypothetical protein n=1 Tax=Streptomyces sp. NPDC056883 TaxID=3345959 RepID=UPI003686641E
MTVSRNAQPHPLAPYASQINPEGIYTLRQVAALLELAPTSVSGMVGHGWLPGSRMRPLARGGRQHTWTGKQLIRIANRPIRVTYDHEKFSASTLYRVGCRCPACTHAHSQDSQARRRALAEEAFNAEQRTQLLDLVGEETPVPEAAKQVGVTIGQVYGRANWDAAFAESLDEAAWALCVLGAEDPKCSTAAGYRGCESGTSPRPPCRGTGCREWRRGASQQTRGALPVVQRELVGQG